ncbi:MAG: hypothetical protein WC700_09905 [Gemmatimonadaceae bacterium]|jgi:uncharacterized BrkB/YihY/UPF0761 family membrane protein
MTLALMTGWVLLAVLVAFAATIIYYMWTGKMDLRRLISEPNGDASMSRFQLLVFTVVVAFGLFLVMVSGDTPKFPDSIPSSVLTLLGISASSYVVSKGIQLGSDGGGTHTDPDTGVVDNDSTDDAAKKKEG